MTIQEAADALAKKLGAAVHRREVLLEQLRRIDVLIEEAKSDLMALEKVSNSTCGKSE